MSQTIVAVLVNLLSIILPKLGLEIGSEALTTTITTLLAIGSGLFIYLRRYQVGDISIVGKRK
jgi:hypothetical protein